MKYYLFKSIGGDGASIVYDGEGLTVKEKSEAVILDALPVPLIAPEVDAILFTDGKATWYDYKSTITKVKIDVKQMEAKVAAEKLVNIPEEII